MAQSKLNADFQEQRTSLKHSPFPNLAQQEALNLAGTTCKSLSLLLCLGKMALMLYASVATRLETQTVMRSEN